MVEYQYKTEQPAPAVVTGRLSSISQSFILLCCKARVCTTVKSQTSITIINYSVSRIRFY